MSDMKCHFCNEEFNKKNEYEEHIKLEPCVIRLYIDKEYYDEFEKVPYFSELYSFKQNASGDNIQIIAKPEKEGDKEQRIFQCKFCDGTFSRIDSLSRHTKKFCKVKKEIEALKVNNPHLEDERAPEEPDLGDFDMEDFKQKFDELMQNYIANRKT